MLCCPHSSLSSRLYLALIFVLVHGYAVGVAAQDARTSRAIEVFEIGRLAHGLMWRDVDRRRGRENLAEVERGEILSPVLT